MFIRNIQNVSQIFLEKNENVTVRYVKKWNFIIKEYFSCKLI